jgi:hypothetical protein
VCGEQQDRDKCLMNSALYSTDEDVALQLSLAAFTIFSSYIKLGPN